MPIYEYECVACGRVHEIIQKISDKPLSDCPECSGKLHKKISNCTFHLKGTGWYVTDYAGGSKTSSSPSNPKADPAPKADSSTPADTSAKTGTKDAE